MAKIEDVAKLAGVSTTTVSRVLNRSGYVAESTRKAVDAAIEMLNYVPNNLGRALRRSETNCIILFSQLNVSYSSRFLDGINSVAEENGYSVMSCVTNGSKALERDLISRAENKLVDGIIFVANDFSTREFMEMNRKFPLVLSSSFRGEGIPCVSIDQEQAGYDTAVCLLRTGRRRIAMVGLDPSVHANYLDDQLRLRGYQRALDSYGIPYDPALVFSSSFNYDGGYAVADHILAADVKPDGLICTQDSMALGCLNAILDKGIRVPEDISVITIDCSDMCELSRPRITAIAQPWYEIGRASVQAILDQKAQGAAYLPRPVLLEHSLIRRESTD